MTSRAKAAKVGVFTFVVGGLLALVLVVFGGLRLWKHQDRYYIDLQDSVMGLSQGTGVYFNGIHVGSVGSIAIDPTNPANVQIGIDIDRSTPIRTDTKAMIDMAGITGLKVVDLKGGSPHAAPLPPGSHIAASPSGFDKLRKQAEIVADETSAMVTQAKQILDGTNAIVERAGGVVDDVAAITANVRHATDRAQLGAIVTATRATVEHLELASRGVDELVGENREALKTSIASVAKASDNASRVANDLRALIKANQGTIFATLADLRQATRTFKDFAREVRERPSRIMFSSAPPERKLP